MDIEHSAGTLPTLSRTAMSRTARSGATVSRTAVSRAPASSPEIDLRARSTHDGGGDPVLHRDDDVEVRSRFDGRWTHGFTIAAIGDHAYQLRRRSDGSVLPAWFPEHMVRCTPHH